MDSQNTDWRTEVTANAEKAKKLPIGTKVRINHPGREDQQGNPVHGLIAVVSSEPRGGHKQFLNVSVDGKFLVCENAASLEVVAD